MKEVIIMVILSLMLISCFYVIVRNYFVCSFRNKLADMAYAYEVRNILKPHDSAFKWLCHKYSYDRMLYSLKPLKLKYWFTEEEIKEINS